MSSPVLTNPQKPAYRKPGVDVYTGLLALAALALILAMICLYFEMQRFEFDLKPPPVMGMASAAAGRSDLPVKEASLAADLPGRAALLVGSFPRLVRRW